MKGRAAERGAFIDGWCRSNGLTRFYGHMLTWAYQMDEPRDIGPVNPFWLIRYDREAQFRLLRRRIEREVRDYRDVNILWDVVNEPVRCLRWGDWSKPINFTEYWQNSDPKQRVTGAHRGGNWSPDLQADAIEQFYRVAFGHPAVDSIIYFGMIDGETESPTLGLLDAEFRPKPAWTRLKKLIKEEWMTRQSVATDASGNCKFRGFFGDYDVRVTSAGNKERAVSVHVAPGKPNEWQFTLE